jgi:hypothetical protein
VTPYREIRADFDRETVVVYQAFPPAIAAPALKAQRFVAPFSFTRMTWIKPSLLWLMERSGWGQKAGQEVTLAVRITRAGWEEALSQAVLSHGDVGHARVVVQWDPERSLRGGKLEHRSIQVGVSRHLSRAYAETWLRSITDLSERVSRLRELRREGRWEEARRLLPPERPYPVSEALALRLGMT